MDEWKVFHAPLEELTEAECDAAIEHLRAERLPNVNMGKRTRKMTKDKKTIICITKTQAIEQEKAALFAELNDES